MGNTHDPNLAHHFDTLGQQFESSKLGMWLFLATEVLFFGGLFCAYAVFRALHPEIFEYGAQFLDKRLGALNTVVLLVSSLTMAVSVTMIQQGKIRETMLMLGATFVCAGMFMGIKYVEYSHKFHEHLVWGTEFYEPPQWVHREMALASGADEDSAAAADAEAGKGHWQAVCRSCHGSQGEGIAGQGKDLRAFSASLSDEELFTFIVEGRTKDDPANTMGILMPPRGGNPLLSDADVRDIVAYTRTLPAAPATSGEDSGSSTLVATAEAMDVWLPRSVIPEPTDSPMGLDRSHFFGPEGPLPHHTVDPDRPRNAHLFFGLYFCLTGLHGIHVLAGMVMIACLMIATARGRYGPRYFTPVDLGALYWHIVDLVWIFLFPLLYLIG